MPESIIIDGLLISYIKNNQEGGRPILLFLHGWRSNKEVWNEVIFNSQFSIFNSYAMDFPGFGQSQVPNRPMTVEDYADVVEGFIKKLNLENVIIVGHSFGGRVGIKMAARQENNAPQPSLRRGGALQKLVLVDSAAFSTNQEKKKLMKVAANIVKPLFKPQFMRPLRKKIYQSIGAEDYVATPELQQTFVNIVNEDLTEDLKKIEVPTLLVWGSQDQDTPVEDGKRMHSLIHNSEFVILPSAGHFSFLDTPDEFMKLLTRFID